jgi:hypothetical protein
MMKRRAMATDSEVLARLTPEVRAVLAERRFAVVASIRADGLPHQTVMWYELQPNELGRVQKG